MLIHGDCLPHLRAMQTKSVGLCLTDPPYGIGHGTQRAASSIFRVFTPKRWDDVIPAPVVFGEMLRVADRQVIWGGNYFARHLPHSRGWLAWYKKDGLPSLQFSDCELAWTSSDGPARVFNCRHHGFVKDSKEVIFPHPSQKPLALMQWCLELFTKPGDLVLDPFAGSGTTAVACILMQRRYIAIERDAEYVQICKRRIALAHLGKV